MKWRDLLHFSVGTLAISAVTLARSALTGGNPMSGTEISVLAIGCTIIMAIREKD